MPLMAQSEVSTKENSETEGAPGAREQTLALGGR